MFVVVTTLYHIFNELPILFGSYHFNTYTFFEHFYISRFFDEKIISLDILFVNTVEKIGAIKILAVLERKIGENNRFFSKC